MHSCSENGARAFQDHLRQQNVDHASFHRELLDLLRLNSVEHIAQALELPVPALSILARVARRSQPKGSRPALLGPYGIAADYSRGGIPLQLVVEELLSLDYIHDSSTCTAESIQHRGAYEFAEVTRAWNDGLLEEPTYRYLVTARESLHNRLSEMGEPERSFSAAEAWVAACEFAAHRQLLPPPPDQDRG
ncbi:hypothetical protein C5B99_03015 [Pseudoclavibacter sp. Z016]|nr:hypothetical protein C5B99_03015 [Pseudoclavibacter sp. Z016]